MKTKTAKTKAEAPRPATLMPPMIGVPPGTLGFLSKAQIASVLAVSQSTFKGMVSDGYYPQPTLRFGKLPRWSITDHNAWCQERQAEKEARLSKEGE